MMAWRASSPGCLFMVKLLMPSRRYRFVGRGGERAAFVPRFRHGWRPRARLVVLSCWYGSCPWRLASMSCPLVSPIRFLPLCVSSCFSFLISSCVSLRSSCLRCVFLVSFSSRSPVACACSICPRARLVPASRRPVSSCVSGGGGSSCAACLTCPDGVLLISSYRLVRRDGERSALMRLRNLFRGIFMNWE